MQRVLITGGAGFVGVNLAAHLQQHGGYEISVLDNESLGDRRHVAPYCNAFFSGDIRNEADLDAAVAGQDCVVHFAADTRVMDSIADPTKNFDVNVAGSFRLLQACRAHGVGRFVAASTGGAILGDAPAPVHEGMVAHPLAPYGASKLAMEGYISAFSGAYGLSGCALRFSNIYGPKSYHKGSVVAHFFKQLLAGEELLVYGDGSQSRDFLFVEDLVAGIRAAIETGATGTFQLGSGRPTTVNELLDLIREVTGTPDLPVRYGEFRAGEVLATWCNIEKARGAFGFDPRTPLAEGLRQTWEWFQGRQPQALAASR